MKHKGMNTTIALIMMIVVALMVVVVLVTIFNTNSGNLENFAVGNSNVTFW